MEFPNLTIYQLVNYSNQFSSGQISSQHSPKWLHFQQTQGRFLNNCTPNYIPCYSWQGKLNCKWDEKKLWNKRDTYPAPAMTTLLGRSSKLRPSSDVKANSCNQLHPSSLFICSCSYAHFCCYFALQDQGELTVVTWPFIASVS